MNSLETQLSPVDATVAEFEPPTPPPYPALDSPCNHDYSAKMDYAPQIHGNGCDWDDWDTKIRELLHLNDASSRLQSSN